MKQNYDNQIFDGLEHALRALPGECGDARMDTMAGMVVAVVDMEGGTRCVMGGLPSISDSNGLRVCLTLLHSMKADADPAILPLLAQASRDLDVALQIRCGELTDKGRRLAARHLQ